MRDVPNFRQLLSQLAERPIPTFDEVVVFANRLSERFAASRTAVLVAVLSFLVLVLIGAWWFLVLPPAPSDMTHIIAGPLDPRSFPAATRP